MAQIIDGKKISQDIKDELKEKVTALKDTGTEVALAVIQVGNDPASSVYVRNKKKACEYIGIRSLSYEPLVMTLLTGRLLISASIGKHILTVRMIAVSISFV